jgi:hypothetical protein
LEELQTLGPELADVYISEVAEVGALVDDPLGPTTVQLVFLSYQELSDAFQQWMRDWIDSIREEASARGIALQAPDFATLSGITASDYLRLHLLPRLLWAAA